MRWVTRENARVDRVACPWLIKRLIDPEAEFLYVPRDQVLAVSKRERAYSFDAEGADYGHRGDKCTFEVLIEDHNLTDPALKRLALIVHGADVPEDVNCTPESAGLRSISEGTALVCPDDHLKLERLFPIYDALYAYCQSQV